MKFVVATLAVCMLGSAFIGCTPGAAPKESPATPIAEKPAPKITVEELALAVDPFCNMSLKEHPIADMGEHEGKKYGFCSSYCKDEFLKDPAKYLAKAAEARL